MQNPHMTRSLKIISQATCNHLYNIYAFIQQVLIEHVLWAENRSKHISCAGVTVVSSWQMRSDGVYILAWGRHTTNISQEHSVKCYEDIQRVRKWRQMARCFLKISVKDS